MMAKREYGKWSSQDMINALNEYKEGKIGLNKCCEKYNIPKKTFLRHYNGQVKRPLECSKPVPINGRLSALPPDVEEELVQHILRFESLMFGLTINDIRSLAFQIMEQNPHLKNPFNADKKKAGKKWYYSFMKRHTELALCQPESIFVARCKGFNRENVFHFFDLLEKAVDENKIDALRLFNVDESGFSTVQKKNPKVVALKGKRQIGALASGERGVNTTLVACASASGNYVPPMIIFKRQRMHPSLSNGATAGSLVEVSESGYINSDLFVKWLNHFIAYVKPDLNSKVLLVLDGHTTHSKNLNAINIARENGVIILQLPGHTTHRLQPLDVAVFKPLETFYEQAVAKWMRTNPGRLMTQIEISSLLSEAYEKAASISNAVNGFRATGIWPVDRNVFSESDFIACENLREDAAPNVTTNEENHDLTAEETNLSVNRRDVDPNFSIDLPEEGLTSPKVGVPTGCSDEQPSSSSSLVVPIQEISPPPNPRQGSRNKGRGAQKSVLLTCSPYKNELQEKKDKAQEKEAKKMSNTNSSARGNSSSRKRTETKNNEDLFRKSRQKARRLNFEEPAVVIDVNIEEWLCFLCGEAYVEDMIRCQVCTKWAHEKCADLPENKDDKSFVCDVCLPC